jgi:hypothetical protein
MATETPSLLYCIMYRAGYEVGFAVMAIGKLIEYIRFPFPRY